MNSLSLLSIFWCYVIYLNFAFYIDNNVNNRTFIWLYYAEQEINNCSAPSKSHVIPLLSVVKIYFIVGKCNIVSVH